MNPGQRQGALGAHPGMSRQPGDGRNNPMMGGVGGEMAGAHPAFAQGYGNVAVHDQLHPPYLAYGGNMIGKATSQKSFCS